MQVQSMMMLDAVFVKNFGEYVRNNKKIVMIYVRNDVVWVLTKEVERKKKGKKEKPA
jgi:K+-transporting ATPase A subunit